MEDPSAAAALAVASGTIASRFETQDAVDDAKARRDQAWKEAYARIGQEPPKQEEEIQDGRTLFERLQTQKELKKEEWDSKMKLSNQYRGLETEELQFLADKAKERRAAERKQEEQENAEISEYREKLAAKNAAMIAASDPSSGIPGEGSTSPTTTTTSAPPRRIPPKPVKKDVKSLMKGVVVKKKPKAAVPGKLPGSGQDKSGSKRAADDGGEVEAKKQKTESR